MGGLEAQTASASTPTEAMQQPEEPDYVALDPSHPAAGGSGESHLDSFFAGSGWTREDLELVLQLASTAILLYWAYKEVA